MALKFTIPSKMLLHPRFSRTLIFNHMSESSWQHERKRKRGKDELKWGREFFIKLTVSVNKEFKFDLSCNIYLVCYFDYWLFATHLMLWQKQLFFLFSSQLFASLSINYYYTFYFIYYIHDNDGGLNCLYWNRFLTLFFLSFCPHLENIFIRQLKREGNIYIYVKTS